MEEKKPVVGPPGAFWPRAAALILDSVIMLFCFSILSIVAAIAIPLMTKSLPKGEGGTIAGLVLTILYIGFPALYFTLSTALWGCTVGKLAFNLRVTRVDGMPVSFIQSFWRWLCSFLFFIPLGLGYWVGIFQKENRTLADLTSGTKVVLIRPYNQPALIVVLVAFPFMSVFVLGILAAIAIPRFAQMLEKSREGATKGNLGAINSALAIYYGDNGGKWPVDLEKDLVPKYLNALGPVKATGAFVSGATSPAGNGIAMAQKGEVPAGSGSGWLYDSSLGKVYVNSTVKDSKEIPYSFYGFE